ncbi:MAG: DNA-processing protein DprA [candidate division Zixibacteria bacterium]|nr:DNA-processing protein DprA [candidate division Zixibacteria bacterium]
MTNNELKEHLTDAIGLLNIPGIGRGRYRKLVSVFGSPSAVLAAPVSQLTELGGFSSALANEIKQSFDSKKARETAARVIQLGWAVLFHRETGYPQVLERLHDSPQLLFRVGKAIEPEEKIIAIVGTRHPTEKGRGFAFHLASSLARAGVTVISGMAEGIDSAAHLGALEAGGKTVAVWGNALDVLYPTSNRELAERIKTQGAIYSEYLPGTKPDRAFFPERNRIISGLSEGVVVVEAGKKSGALITAARALEHGRELFAVPGSPDARMSKGTNELIKKGARLTTSADDIFAELPALKGKVLARRFLQMPEMTEGENNIVKLLSSGAMQIDQLSRETDLPIEELMELLLALELKGVLSEISGKRFTLSEGYL